MELARELLFPSICYLCSGHADSGMPLCPDCLAKVEFIGSRCEICGEPFTGEGIERLCGDCLDARPHFEKARAWVKFQDPVSEIAHRFKYQRAFHFLDWMAEGMIRTASTELSGQRFDMIIPVPLHWRRLLTRGYNQALILARPVSRALKIPVRAGALVRAVHNPPQVGLSRPARKENMKKVFKVTNPKKVAGKNILLLDDVITTGATMDEAAKVLKKAGAKSVCALAFARA